MFFVDILPSPFSLFQVSKANFASFCLEKLNFPLNYGDTIGNMIKNVEDGYERNILNLKEEANIMSVKGTVRGVKNRVKTGIATFLQDQKKKVNRKMRNI